MSEQSQKQEQRTKRGYKVGGVNLACDIRVRITAADSELLSEYAKKHGTTRAEAVRLILHNALNLAEN